MIVVHSPPSPAARAWFLVREIRRSYASGPIVALTGHGPKSFARGYQALAEVGRRHTLALHDPTGVTAQWERITKQTEPRSASRSGAADVPWVLHAMRSPFSFPVIFEGSSHGEELPDQFTSANGETVLRGEHDLTYIIGEMTYVAVPMAPAADK